MAVCYKFVHIIYNMLWYFPIIKNFFEIDKGQQIKSNGALNNQFLMQIELISIGITSLHV